jgi:hypothetical protein
MYTTKSTGAVTVTVEPSVADTKADHVRVETPDCGVSIPRSAIAQSGNLVITVEKIETPVTARIGASLNPFYAAASKNEVTYKITVNNPTKENIKYSFDPAPGDVEYQAVFDSNGNPVGGKYNPITEKIDVYLKAGGTYTVRENKIDFSDISGKSRDMQEAIKVLASKGIFTGATDKTFKPDDKITRAEVASFVVRMLSILDENADGKFTDVKKADWYYGAVGSAAKHELMSGATATTFEPKTTSKKDQLTAVTGRVLRTEMKYKTPKDREKYLKKFKDRSELPEKEIDDIAVASMADLIILRTDGKFNPSDAMTRGDAAIVLYRLFMLIW